MTATVLADVLAGAVAGVVALTVRFGFDADAREPWLYSWITLAMPLVWLFSLWVARAHEVSFLGVGTEEWRRVAQAAAGLAACIGVVAFAAKYDLARGYVLVAVPLAAATSTAGRYALRRRLRRERKLGRNLHRVVAVGHSEQVSELVQFTEREPADGMVVVGVCVPEDEQSRLTLTHHIQAVGDLDAVIAAVRKVAADTVVVTSCPELTGAALRRLTWNLERTGTDLVVAPGLVEVTWPRLHVRPVSSLSLLHVEHPALSGGRRLLKHGIDRVAALLLLLLLSPALLAIGLAIRLTSDGPTIYRQTRVGRDGREFTVLKFRTMVIDADHRRSDLLELNESDGPLFKLRRDPRITSVGAKLRRYSLDELPQLVNVVKGDMSLIGPRPPLPEEVAAYESDVQRRLRVKPGMTGLWQVSGRADLDWEESFRLDLRYVENWSLTLDLIILWRTVSAVLRGRGAY